MSTAVTLINVFTAKPGKQQDLAKVLAEGTRTFFSKQPGSLSSSVVVGGDGSKVVNISQWHSAEDIAAFRSDPRFAEYMKTLGVQLDRWTRDRVGASIDVAPYMERKLEAMEAHRTQTPDIKMWERTRAKIGALMREEVFIRAFPTPGGAPLEKDLFGALRPS